MTYSETAVKAPRQQPALLQQRDYAATGAALGRASRAAVALTWGLGLTQMGPESWQAIAASMTGDPSLVIEGESALEVLDLLAIALEHRLGVEAAL